MTQWILDLVKVKGGHGLVPFWVWNTSWDCANVFNFFQDLVKTSTNPSFLNTAWTQSKNGRLFSLFQGGLYFFKYDFMPHGKLSARYVFVVGKSRAIHMPEW